MMPEQVVAQVILRAPDGSSVLDLDHPPTPAESARLRPTLDTFRIVEQRLLALGFSVEEPGATGFTITAERRTFERTFRARLRRQENGDWHADDPLTPPDDLRDLIADVALSRRPEFMP